MTTKKTKTTKNCRTCKQELPVSEFWVCNSAKDGLQSSCKVCGTKYTKEWYKSEKGKAYLKKYMEETYDRDACRERAAIWRDKERDSYRKYQREYQQKRRELDPIHYTNCKTRNFLNRILKRFVTGEELRPCSFERFEEAVGISLPNFVKYVETVFKKEYGVKLDWNRWSIKTPKEDRIEIDHRSELQNFNTTNKKGHQAAWKYTNLHLIPWHENRFHSEFTK